MSKRLRLSLRGPGRGRGNLAGSLRIFGKLRRIRNILCEISTSLRPPPCNDKTGTFDKPGTVWESQTVKKSPLCRIMPTSYRNNLLQGKRMYAIMQKNVGTISASCRLILQREKERPARPAPVRKHRRREHETGCHLYADRGAGAAACGRRGRRRCRAAGHDNTGDHSNGRRLRRADRADAWGQTPGAYAVVPYGRGLPSGGQLAELVRHGVVLVSGR